MQSQIQQLTLKVDPTLIQWNEDDIYEGHCRLVLGIFVSKMHSDMLRDMPGPTSMAQ